MSIPYHTEANPGKPDQIKLFVRCTSEHQAEALWRVLRSKFVWVSNLRSSFNASFSHFFFLTTSMEAFKSTWPAIEDAISSSTAHTNGEADTQLSHQSATQLGDLKAWDRQFRAAVRRVHTEIPQQSVATQDISLGWVVEQVRAGNGSEVEALLNGPLISPVSALRAQIALFSETNQHERLIALVEARRREVLALPVSGLLAEQIVGAYLTFARDNSVEDALRSAQQIAQALLPELERLRQADGVRDLLRHGLAPITPLPEAVTPTLSEQLAGIIQVIPTEQIIALEALRADHPGAFDLQLALGSAYAAVNQIDAALAVYAGVTTQDDVQQAEIIMRQLELLVDSGQYQKAIALQPPADNLSPVLSALYGTALYWIGRSGEARKLLEQAWDAGERRRIMLLPIARSRVSAGQDDLALQPYRLLLDNASELLEPEDLARLSMGLYIDRPDDISSVQIVDLCDRYLQFDGPMTRPTPEVNDILRLRVDLWASLNRERWLEALADRLDWLATQQHIEQLQDEFDTLRMLAASGQLERREHFELLEGLEMIALTDTAIRVPLADEYQSMCITVIDLVLLRNESIPSFIKAAQRSLHFLNRDAADFIAEYIADEREQLIKRSHTVTDEVFASDQSVSLATLRLTIIGGHVAMRREVERELREHYYLDDYLEVPPSTEAHVDHNVVRDRVVERDLVVVVTSYSGHDLTNHVRTLQQVGTITGRIIWPRCRGKSGVIREILASL